MRVETCVSVCPWPLRATQHWHLKSDFIFILERLLICGLCYLQGDGSCSHARSLLCLRVMICLHWSAQASASARLQYAPWVASDPVSRLRFVLSSSPPAVHFDLPLIFDPLSKSSLSAAAQPRSANPHFSLQIWARSRSVWASDSLFEAAPWLSPLRSEKIYL